MELNKELSNLSDEALTAMARAVRREAGQGHRPAYGRAHELEKEVRRRSLAVPHSTAALATADHTLAVLPAAPTRHWWQFWRRT